MVLLLARAREKAYEALRLAFSFQCQRRQGNEPTCVITRSLLPCSLQGLPTADVKVVFFSFLSLITNKEVINKRKKGRAVKADYEGELGRAPPLL